MVKKPLKEKLLEPLLGQPRFCFIGFDGFIDQISSAVSKREIKKLQLLPTIDSFAERIASFAGKSGNIELMLKQIKIGGNAPILANALIEGGHAIALAGFFGAIEPNELFLPLLNRCKNYFNLGENGASDAIEFQDGKVILGKMGALRDTTAETILSKLSKPHDLLEKADLFASVNWTMLPMMNAFWEILLNEIIPSLSKKKRIFFVDLADPEKRSDEDLAQALNLLKRFQDPFEVHLGVNIRESLRVAKVLGISEEFGISLAKMLRNKLGISKVILHHAQFACDDSMIISAPFTSTPLLTTGAGDNFNAGYLNALLYGWSLEEALTLGVYTASFYVIKGKSPTREELALFLEEKLN